MKITKITKILVISIVAASLITAFLSSFFAAQVDKQSYLSGPITLFALPSPGFHASGEPKNVKDCATEMGDGGNVLESGWPIRHTYDDWVGKDCTSAFYPVAYLLDALFFAAVFVLLRKLILRLGRSPKVTPRRVVVVAFACAVALTVTYETSRIVRIALNPPVLPILSSITDTKYQMPFMFQLCPSANDQVEKLYCEAISSGCLLAEFTQPSDPRQFLVGWPLAYDYNSLDYCFGDMFYPLVFLSDALVFAVTLSAAGIGLEVYLSRRRALQS